MITNVKARYANGALVPLEPLDLEEGAEVTVSVAKAPQTAPAGESISEMFARLRESTPPDTWDGFPTDFSKNKNHYLYGHPKEEG